MEKEEEEKEDWIWEDEIGSVYCYNGGGFIWIIKE